MGIKNFMDLIVWQKSHLLSVKIRDLTELFPPREYRHAEQMRSASASIPQNIAEGFGRWSPGDQAHFYTIAKDSTDELKAQLIQARDWKLCSDIRELLSLADEVCAMLYRLRQRVLEKKPRR